MVVVLARQDMDPSRIHLLSSSRGSSWAGMQLDDRASAVQPKMGREVRLARHGGALHPSSPETAGGDTVHATGGQDCGQVLDRCNQSHEPAWL